MKKKVILIVIVLVILGYFTYQGYYLNYYSKHSFTKENYEKMQKGLTFKEPITIKSKTQDINYLSYKNLKIRDDFQNFEKEDLLDETISSYILKDENNRSIASLTMGIEDYTYLDYLKADDYEYYNVDIKNTTSKDRIRFLQKYNIKNDVDFLKVMSKHPYPQFNIFTPVKTMKSEYSILLMSSIIIPEINYINEIKGDYQGYILNLDKLKEVHIIKNNKTYYFRFTGFDYFTDDYIGELLNTIVIE